MHSKSNKPIRILIVDDHTIVRKGLAMLIENQTSMAVAGEAGNLDDAIAVVAREQPDVIVLDLDLGKGVQLERLQDLIAKAGQSRVIILTGIRDPAVHQRAVALGAVGLVLKDQASETLIKAIEKVSAGEVWLERSMMARVLDAVSRPGEAKRKDAEAAKIATLTKRELEIIALITQGLPNKQIADSLFISEKTVRNHLVSIYSKLGVSDRLELAIYASRNELFPPSR